MDDQLKNNENLEIELEDKAQKSNEQGRKKKIICILVATIIFSFLILCVGGMILFRDGTSKPKVNNSIPNAYRYTGEILFSQNIGDYTIATEFISENSKIGNINLTFLYNNVLVNNLIIAENIDISDFSDYGIIFNDYNNDGTIDFSYISSRNGNNSVYRIYTISNDAKIIRLNEEEYTFSSKKFSIGLTYSDGKYTYDDSKLYYDGYEISQDAGTYSLKGDRNINYKKVHEGSKLSFPSGKSIKLPKYTTEEKLSDEFLERHSLLKNYTTTNIINIDLDSDGNMEKIVYLFDETTKNTRIIAFDSIDEVIAILFDAKGKKYEQKDVLEFFDIDGDNIIEFIIKAPDKDEVEVTKYHGGYYFPKVIYG